MRPWSPTGVCGPLAFLAVYCSTSLPPGVFSFRVTLDRVQYECLRAARGSAQQQTARRQTRRPRASAARRRARHAETLSPGGAHRRRKVTRCTMAPQRQPHGPRRRAAKGVCHVSGARALLRGALNQAHSALGADAAARQLRTALPGAGGTTHSSGAVRVP